MKNIPIILFVSILFIACKKDEVTPNVEPEPVVYHSITAGESDSNDSTVSFSNPTPFTIQWDAQLLYGVGMDSLDLDFDGVNDIYFVLNVLNFDSIQLLTGIPDPLPSLWVHSLTGSVETVKYKESVPIGMGGYNYYYYADKYEFGETISETDDWITLGSGGLMIRTDSPGMGGPQGGPWSGDGYMAFRINGKYGWLHIDLSNNDNPLIMGWSIEE